MLATWIGWLRIFAMAASILSGIGRPAHAAQSREGMDGMERGAPDILLVEDSATSVELFRYALQTNRSQAKVQVVADGEAALLALLGSLDTPSPSALPPLPQLVLLDLHLPKISGLEVLERLRNHPYTQSLPVVMLSASSFDEDRAEAQRLGANEFLRKPAEFPELCTMLDRLEREWLVPGCGKPASRPK